MLFPLHARAVFLACHTLTWMAKLFGYVYWKSAFTQCVCVHSHVLVFHSLLFSAYLYMRMRISKLNRADSTLCKCLVFKCLCSFSWDSDHIYFTNCSMYFNLKCLSVAADVHMIALHADMYLKWCKNKMCMMMCVPHSAFLQLSFFLSQLLHRVVNSKYGMTHVAIGYLYSWIIIVSAAKLKPAIAEKLLEVLSEWYYFHNFYCSIFKCGVKTFFLYNCMCGGDSCLVQKATFSLFFFSFSLFLCGLPLHWVLLCFQTLQQRKERTVIFEGLI